MTAKKFEYGPERKLSSRSAISFLVFMSLGIYLQNIKSRKAMTWKGQKNGKDKVSAYCLSPNFKWKMYASLLPDGKTFMIKTLKHKHTCVRPLTNNAATAIWIAKKILPYISVNPNTSDEVIETMLQQQFGLGKPNRMKMWRAMTATLAAVQGTHAELSGCSPSI